MMDAFKKLQFEIDGIEKNLKDYSDEAPAVTIMPKLREAIENVDKEGMIYCLDVIVDWYYQNLGKINNNEWVFNKETHYRNAKLLESIRDEMIDLDISGYRRNEARENAADDSPLVFLSHCSKDKKYGDALEKFLVGLGLKNDQLIYSSHPLHKVPLGKNIYSYLRENIHKNIFMIILWSDDYLESPACLNEMGAAWVVQCDYTNIYVPTFSFGNPKYRLCAVDTSKMGAVLNGDRHCKQSMLELKDKIQEIFGLDNDEATVMYLTDAFIEEIKG